MLKEIDQKMLAIELKNMVIKYQCFLDKEHIEFFKDMISELQPYDTAYPFKYSIYGLH